MITVDPYMTLAEIQTELQRLTYRPGWSFEATQDPFEGIQLRIVAPAVPNSYGGDPVDLGVDGFLPPIPDVDYLHRFLAWRLGRVELHEMREFLRRDGKPVFDPHAEEAA